MSQSCWYQTSVPNLWRYARNRGRNLFYDPDADVERAMNSTAPAAAQPTLSAVTAGKAVRNSK
jgi:hypothetical protein